MTTVAEAFVTLRPDVSKFKTETERSLINLGAIGKTAALGIFAAGAAVTGVAALSIKAAVDEQASLARLSQAVISNGGDWTMLGNTIEGQITQWEKLTAFSREDMESALSTLTAVTGDANVALERLPIAMDFARGAGLDLATTSRLLGKVTDETTTVLARYGIRVEKGADATDVLRLVQQKFAGQSVTFAKTAAGQWAIFTNQLTDLRVQLGTLLLPILLKFTSAAVAGVDALSKKVEQLKPQIQAAARLLNGVAEIAVTAFRWLFLGDTRFPFTEALKNTFGIVLPAQVFAFVQTVRDGLAEIPGFVLQVAGSIGEMFDVLTGRRPSAGGVLRTLVGDTNAVAIQRTLAGVRDAFTEVFDFMKPIIQGVIDKVIELKNRFEDLPPVFKNLVGATAATGLALDGLSFTMITIGSGIATIFSGIVNVLDSQVLVKLTKLVWGLTGALLSNVAAMSLWDPLIALTFDALSLPLIPLALVAAAILAVGAAIFLLVTHWDEVSESGRLIAQIVGIVVGRAFNALGTAVSDFLTPFGQLKDLFARDFPFALGLLAGAIFNTFGDAQRALGDFITNSLETLGGWKTDLGNLIGTAVRGLLDGLGDLAGRAIPEIVKFVISAGEEVTKLQQQFTDAARDALIGFVHGIFNNIPDVVAQLKDAAGQFIAGFKTALGIHSPSTVFAEAGRNITQGLVKGIGQGRDSVANALASLTESGSLADLSGVGITTERTLNVVLDVKSSDGSVSALQRQAIQQGALEAMQQVFGEARVALRGLA